MQHVAVLHQIPLALLPSFLNEAIGYDWKLPAERAQIGREMKTLTGLSSDQLASRMAAFSALRLNGDLEAADWINVPSAFLEQLTAWLWSTHQMDAFHRAANDYTAFLTQSAPVLEPATPRLVAVTVGKGIEDSSPASTHPLFRKLRPQGTYFTRLKPENGFDLILDHASRRASGTSDDAFAHWYIDGGTLSPAASPALTQIAYDALAPARAALLDRTQQTITSGNSGPEALRSMLAQMKPEDVGLGSRNSAASSNQPILDRFQLSLLTQGSGTQIFSTTFVQWAARECLRRAQPSTLVLRFAPRQKQQTMNAMLSGAPVEGVDSAGSLIDADMGAYYTWLNLQRLPGSAQSRFLVWFEGRSQALAIAPGLPRGTVADTPLDMKKLLGLLV